MMRTGGRLLHEWPLLMSLLWRPSPSDRSTLAAKLLKASLPQNFFHIILSQKVVSGGDLKKGVPKGTFDIILGSLILNECTFIPTMCTPEGQKMSIMMISQM